MTRQFSLVVFAFIAGVGLTLASFSAPALSPRGAPLLSAPATH